MPTRITVDQVALVLKSHKDISPATLRAVIEQLNEETQSSEDDVKPPRAKQQYVVVVSDPEGKIKQDLVGWVVQLPEEASPHVVIDKVRAAAHDFNASKKGRLLPVASCGEAFESVPRKHFKNNDISVKTKTPIYLIRTDNTLGDAPTA